jgi:serine/threonine-protein phosphatase 2A activator
MTQSLALQQQNKTNRIHQSTIFISLHSSLYTMTDTPFPRRFIFNEADMANFKASRCKSELLKFTAACGKSCAHSTDDLFDPEHPYKGLSPSMACLVGSLHAMQVWHKDYPPVDRSQARFGNPAFRSWHKRLVDKSVVIIYTVLQQAVDYPGLRDYDESVLEDSYKKGQDAASSEEALSISKLNDITDTGLRRHVQELSAYWQDAFGHAIRLDYGTGHESSFQVFLYCLCKMGAYGSTASQPPSLERLKATTIAVYSAYLQVTRIVQTDYMLEPAGSHGVWGLDDYHCLPFYYGACQLQTSEHEEPSDIHQDSLLEREGNVYLYFGCIRYIKQLKKGVPFFEHSPMLNDISRLPTWSKVASGLFKLYEGEVLNKRQVVQHFVFGDVFAADWEPSQQDTTKAPTETFRAAARIPSTLSGPSGLPVTRAPWASDSGSGGVPSTKAPWAK